MARTLERQRARKERDANIASAVTTEASNSVHEQLWAKFEQPLLGLLRVEVDCGATNAESVCPKSVRLVVRLDLVRAEGAHDSVARRMQHVMDALGMLGVVIDISQMDREVFWTRLVTSDMMTQPWASTGYESKLHDLVAFSSAHCVGIVLSWEKREFQPYAAPLVGRFLRSPRRFYEWRLGTKADNSKPLCVGLRFVDCQLSTSDLVLVMQALRLEQVTSELDTILEDPPLCAEHTLLWLEFDGVKLEAAGLEVMAAGIGSHDTRLVESLHLQRVIQLDNSYRYMSAFKSVLVAALQSKHGNFIGLRISLANNDIIQPAHIEALHEALNAATRPLCGLDLSGIPGRDVALWLQLGRIFFTPSRIQPKLDSELTVSHFPSDDDFTGALKICVGNLIGELLPRVRAALRDSVLVYCRVHHTSSDLSAHQTYRVIGVQISGQSLGGSLQISASSDPERRTWVDSLSINHLRIGGEDVVCCRFPSLVLHCADYYAYMDDEARRLCQLFGSGLRRLSLCNYRSFRSLLPNIMDVCPNIHSLDLQHCHIEGRSSIWDWAAHRPLQLMSLRSCDVSTKAVNDILWSLLQSQQNTLRFLNLNSNNEFDSETLDMLLKLFQTQQLLVRVEMPFTCLNSKWTEDLTLRHQLQLIDEYLDTQYLSPGLKLSFLSVMRHERIPYLGTNAIRNVFAFTGSPQKRMLRWCKQWPEEKCL